MIERPALKYNGGKFRLREWVISHFPKHKTYVETCLGGGSVLLSKPRAIVEIGNDLDGNIQNFFQVLRNSPKALIRKIHFTPYSEDSMSEAFHSIGDDDPINRAWAFYCMCWMSLRANDIRQSSLNFRIKGNLQGEGGHSPARLFSKTRHLYQIAERLRGVILTRMDAEELIRVYDTPDTLFYVDLPYLGDSRNTQRLYNLELTGSNDHQRILKALAGIQGMAVVSHYVHPLYDSTLDGWEVVTKDTLSNNFQRGAGKVEKKRTEALYLSPRVSENLHPRLFAEVV